MKKVTLTIAIMASLFIVSSFVNTAAAATKTSWKSLVLYSKSLQLYKETPANEDGIDLNGCEANSPIKITPITNNVEERRVIKVASNAKKVVVGVQANYAAASVADKHVTIDKRAVTLCDFKTELVSRPVSEFSVYYRYKASRVLPNTTVISKFKANRIQLDYTIKP